MNPRTVKTLRALRNNADALVDGLTVVIDQLEAEPDSDNASFIAGREYAFGEVRKWFNEYAPDLMGQPGFTELRALLQKVP